LKDRTAATEITSSEVGIVLGEDCALLRQVPSLNEATESGLL
jgi:hypothetical protein